MKAFFKPGIVSVFIISTACNQQSTQEADNKKQNLPVVSDTVNKQHAEPKNETPYDNIADYANLVPIDMLNKNAGDVYEKYGIEFSGNCYECDLAAININKKSVELVNVCDKANTSSIEHSSYVCSPSELVIETQKNKFTFTKIDAAPVYELKISGEKLSLKGIRISQLYTQKEKLKKFIQHDCGQFDG